MDHVADAVDGGVDPRAQERSDQALGFVVRAFAPVGCGEDLRAPAVRFQIGAPTRFCDPDGGLRGCGKRLFDQAIARAECIESGRGIRNEIVAAIVAKPDQIGKNLQGIGLAQVGDGVDVATCDQLIGQRVGPCLPLRHDVAQRGQRRHFGHQTARALVQRRIGFEQQRGWTPGLLDLKICQTDTATRYECLPVLERGLHFGMAGHRVISARFEQDDWRGVAQDRVVRIGIAKNRLVERVEAQCCSFRGSGRGSHHAVAATGTAEWNRAEWNRPPFMIAVNRALSCRMVTSCVGSPSTIRISAR